MNKLYLIITSLLFCSMLYAQKGEAAKSYRLNFNAEKDTVSTDSVLYTMNLYNTEDGTLEILVDDRKMWGIVKAFKTELEIRDGYGENTISREFIKKNRTTINEIFGQSVRSKKGSEFEGKTAEFVKENEEWVLQNNDDFGYDAVISLTQFYDPTKKESEMIIYPDNLRVGETRVLTKENFSQSADKEGITTGLGTIKLVEVLLIDGEEIAVLELDCKTLFSDDLGKETSSIVTNFKGIVHRSLRSFIDIKGNFEIDMKMIDGKYSDELLLSIATTGITGEMKTTCTILE